MARAPSVSSLLLTLTPARTLGFLQCDGAHDQAQNWANLSASQREKLKDQYNHAGVSIVVTAFGANDLPATAGRDPTSVAESMAQFVQGNHLDGIDVDYEEVKLMQDKSGAAEAWVSTYTQALRSHLPKGQFILSHARTSLSSTLHVGLSLTEGVFFVLVGSGRTVVRSQVLSGGRVPRRGQESRGSR